MAVTFWAGKPPGTTHEARAREMTIESFTAAYANDTQPIFVIFDFYCGSDLDLAVLKPDAILVGELKECSTPIEGAVNGSWVIRDGSVPPTVLKGGHHGNPFEQAKQYRYDLIRYLDREKERFLSAQKASQMRFDHVAAAVVVSPALNPQSKINIDFGRNVWFHTVGLDALPKLTQTLHSSQLSFSEGELRCLVADVLHCEQVVGEHPAVSATISHGQSTPAQVLPRVESYERLHVDPQAAGEYRSRAESGDSVAQVQWGSLLEHGLGVPQDDQKAVSFYRLAAAQGNLDALVALGTMYISGRGIPAAEIPNAAWQAAQLFHKAAERGHPPGQYNLGLTMLRGQGAAQDLNAAVYWLQKAAEAGWAEAAFELGQCYLEGVGVRQSAVEALTWLEKAADLGSAEAAFLVGGMYSQGVGVARHIVEAIGWFRRAANLGSAVAAYYLGEIYYEGRGVEKDATEASHWLDKAARLGHADAQFMIGCLYSSGEGVPANPELAFSWMKKAAEQGNPMAWEMLAMFYEEGVGTAQNREEALKWRSKSAAHYEAAPLSTSTPPLNWS